MSSSKMEIETAEKVLTIRRVFDAPRELVFETFTTCDHLANWWGPREWPLASCQMDFREGGIWSYCMQGPEGQLSCGKALYQRIQQPELIQFEDYFTDEAGQVNPEFPSSVSTYQFTEQGDQTLFTGRTEYREAADLQKVLEMGVVAGMTETLDRLEEHLATL